MYDHYATTPGTTRQSPANGAAVHIPKLAGIQPSRPTIRYGHNPSFIIPPPPPSAGIGQLRGDIAKEKKSVAEVIYNASPLENITGTAAAIKEGVEGRPLIPPGWKDRATNTLPDGIRERATAWTRNLARWRSKRVTMPVARE